MSGFLESFLTLGWWALWPQNLSSSLSLSPSPVLFAMKEDNEKVPTLLTDYILKGKSSPQASQSRAFPGPQASDPACPEGAGPGATLGQLWGPGRERVLSMDVARRLQKEIPSPRSHQSDCTLGRPSQHNIVKVLWILGCFIGKNTAGVPLLGFSCMKSLLATSFPNFCFIFN